MGLEFGLHVHGGRVRRVAEGAILGLTRSHISTDWCAFVGFIIILSILFSPHTNYIRTRYRDAVLPQLLLIILATLLSSVAGGITGVGTGDDGIEVLVITISEPA